MEKEKIEIELKKAKTEHPDEFSKATEKLSEYIKKYPALKDDKNLQYMIVYSYLHVGDKINSEIENAFKEYIGPYKAISDKLKRDPKTILLYLYIALDQLVQKSDKAHNVYVIAKKDPRIVGVPNRSTGEVEEKKVMNITLWIDDMKVVTTLAIWDDQILMYDNIKPDKTYKMQINYNGQAFFAPKDPMAKEFSFVPDYSEMLKYITENFTEMKEPFSALENSPMNKTFFMIGRVLKEAGGNVLIFPTEPTTSKVSLMRNQETMQLDDGEDIMVLGSMRRSKSFQGRDGKTYEPSSDYTLFPNAIIRLSAPPEEQNENTVDNVVKDDNVKDDSNMVSSSDNINPADLGL